MTAYDNSDLTKVTPHSEFVLNNNIVGLQNYIFDNDFGGTYGQYFIAELGDTYTVVCLVNSTA